MIDLHSHVLPGIDDGPETLDESVEFVRSAANHGIELLAATPHLREDFPGVDVRRIAAGCDGLAARLPSGIGLTLVPGAEVDIYWARAASDEDLRLASFGQRGSDLLVETPYGDLSDTFEQVLFQIALRGFRILLAHPERNPTFQRDPGRLARLVDRGVLLQITLPSLVRGDRRSRSRRLALDLVRDGLAHNLASDSHSAGPWRAPNLGDGVRALADVAPARARWMVTDAPAAILEGETLPRAPREQPRRRRFGLLRGG